jgi:glutathione S-transferase
LADIEVKPRRRWRNSMLKIHGTSMSRTGRVLWMAEEVGVKFEHIPTPIADAKSPAHLKLNPNGHVPVIDDDGFVLYESMAINFYLAAKYGKAPLWPESLQGRALANQWSYWAMLEVEPHLVTLLRNRMFLPPDQRDEKAAAVAADALKAPLQVIEQYLSGRDYILGKEFTIADLNVASVWYIGQMVQLDFSAAPKTAEWLAKCTSRPANERGQLYK